MENKYAAVASEKEDEKLLQLLEERADYEAEAILAVIDEITKRNLPVPDLEQIREEALQQYNLQQSSSAPETPVPTSFSEKIKDFGAFFVPTRHYFVTPILININILIFAVMALAGVHVLTPEGQDMIAAGANFGPYTLTGEWWRLLSSMFLHIGVIHLLLNMYALASIGGALEPLIGRRQFITAYILCGLAGSLTSLWWDQFRISAGASGAIFGMFGMFMIMVLLERKMTWQEKKGMVYNMLIVIGINLAFGMKGGIDNAAHTGGLVLGVIYGGVLLLRSGRYISHSYGAIGNVLTVVVTFVAFAGLYLQIPTATAKYLITMERFGEREQEALTVMEEMMRAGDNFSGTRFTNELQQGIAIWDESIAELVVLEELPELGEKEAKEVEIMLNYARLRKTSYQMMLEDVKGSRQWFHPKQQQVLWAISTYVQELQNLREGKEGEMPVAEMPDESKFEALAELDPDARPLFVVDGVMLDSKQPVDVEMMTSNINPDDIASIEVLKGDAAVERYGEEARNGVILISTKKE